jgi:hypothetical protein
VKEKDDQERGERAADRRSAIEQRDRPGALASRKPFGDGLGCARPTCGFFRAQQSAEDTEAA